MCQALGAPAESPASPGVIITPCCVLYAQATTPFTPRNAPGESKQAQSLGRTSTSRLWSVKDPGLFFTRNCQDCLSFFLSFKMKKSVRTLWEQGATQLPRQWQRDDSLPSWVRRQHVELAETHTQPQATPSLAFVLGLFKSRYRLENREAILAIFINGSERIECVDVTLALLG